MLPLNLFYNSAQDFIILNIIYSHVVTITVPVIYVHTTFMFA
jgi:hypothetical protein